MISGKRKSTGIAVTQEFEVTDGPVLRQRYTRTPRRYRVVQVTFTWRLGEDGRWRQDGLARVGGPLVKKDGTDSSMWHNRHVVAHDMAREPDTWGWLSELIEHMRPSGAMTLPESDFQLQDPGPEPAPAG